MSKKMLRTKYKSVMVIDDYDIDLFLAKNILKDIKTIDYVSYYENAQHAISFLANVTGANSIPNIILLDLKMPIFSGEDFLEEFQKLPSAITAHTKIIILSAYIEFHEAAFIKEKAFPCIYKILGKPLSQQALEKIIDELR